MDLTTGYNETYYLLRNKDVRVAVENGQFKNGFEHFSKFGHSENRGFSEYFDPEYYARANPDVANAAKNGGLSAFQHFITYGHEEGRARIRVIVPLRI